MYPHLFTFIFVKIKKYKKYKLKDLKRKIYNFNNFKIVLNVKIVFIEKNHKKVYLYTMYKIPLFKYRKKCGKNSP